MKDILPSIENFDSKLFKYDQYTSDVTFKKGFACTVLRNMPEKDYHNLDSDKLKMGRFALSSSLLSLLSDSPKKFMHDVLFPSKPTKLMYFGTKVHTLLKGDAGKWIVEGQCEAILKKPAGKQCSRMFTTVVENVGSFCKTHIPPHIGMSKLESSTEVITMETDNHLRALCDAVKNDKYASHFMDSCKKDDRELSVFWKNDTYPLIHKARFDGLCASPDSSEYDTIYDFKTTTSSKREDFEKDLIFKGYARQAAMYREGFEKCFIGKKLKNFIFIVIERNPPFDTVCYRVDDEVMDQAKTTGFRNSPSLDYLIYRFWDCVEKNQWPGHSEDRVVSVNVPAWAVIKDV